MALVLVFIPRNFGIHPLYAKSVPKKKKAVIYAKKRQIHGKSGMNPRRFYG